MKKLLFSILAVAMFWSCGKDDGPTPSVDENSVPVIASKTFTVAETISDTEVIGKVTATDADDDTLTFTIATNSDALFEITAAGDLSLASGKTLDAATKEQHAITVKVDDGEDSASATITIKVTSIAPTNQAPEMTDQNFSILENHVAGESMGAIEATDADGDALTFTMKENDNDLFAVSESGVLTLAEGKTLDYETATSHSITVSVTDSEETVEATITITVEDVAEADPNDKAAFVTTWKTEVDGEEISLYLWNEHTNNFIINWGDGTVEHIDVVPDGELLPHTYDTAGTYSVSIQGELPSISIEVNSRNKLMSIEQWGAISWKSLFGAFSDCENMIYNASDAPDLSNVEDMSEMFINATSFNGDLSGWDTSNITNMSYMFEGATLFDQDLGDWDISSVEFMSDMFDANGMSALNFSNTLIGWAGQEVQPNVTLGAEGLHVCFNDASGLAAFTTLSSEPNNWEFEWDGLKNCN
ncbi:BspA family leucine-rich repeat surface protein [Muricauda sp. HICW]|uniref:BspA family leucine-rich repeat surface protein n=1 Tax=Flagellimonas chongwuensis TaxID=2697365 RepID=A0A850NJ70_9FLAO|nr:BspA family leucine-rich repeat surface protein [Allomuricauda chongwuensis]NVN18572.1 BspA family leucine-rich repeat surface protein [Allomuricauda chongwuensis]